MKERPILFSAQMVQAILSGNKIQTRRVIKPKPYIDTMGNACWNGSNYGQDGNGNPLFKTLASPLPSSKTGRVHCPYGKPDDRLWVRETWAYGIHAISSDNYEQEGPWVYAADNAGTRGRLCDCWRPSIHMRRAASRITLEITDVRVERLHDISEADAEAEGVDFMRRIPDVDETLTTKNLYESLWESINGGGSWDANPWVWVIEFRQIDAATSAAVSL